MLLVCPHCQAINRVPPERLDQHPKCGQCGHDVLQDAPVELTQQTFERFITRNELPVVVDFWAPWCGPCKMMAPIYAQVSAELKTRYRFAKVDTEAEQQLAARFMIRSIPTLALFHQGREVDRLSGAVDAGHLKAWLAQHAL